MRNPVRITMRHTGRVYIGLDADHFGTLMGVVKHASVFLTGESSKHSKNLVESMDKFLDSLTERVKGIEANNFKASLKKLSKEIGK